MVAVDVDINWDIIFFHVRFVGFGAKVQGDIKKIKNL